MNSKYSYVLCFWILSCIVITLQAQIAKPLTGQFKITFINAIDDVQYEVKGIFTDISPMNYQPANISIGDRIVDGNGNMFEILTIQGVNGSEISALSKALNGQAPIIGTGILYNPTSSGYPMMAVGTSELVMANVINTSNVSIDANIPKYSFGTLLPTSTYSVGDVVQMTSDLKLYKLISTGWSQLAEGDIPTSYSNPVTDTPPGSKGEVVLSYWDGQWYVFDGTSWVPIVKISSMPTISKYGDVFYVTGEQKLYMSDADSKWISISGSSTPGGPENEIPTDSKTGDIFFNTDNNTLLVFNSDGKWVEVSINGSTPKGIFNPDPATVTVNEGALFYNTSDHKLYVYNGTVWMPADNILPNGQIYVGNTSNIATPVTVSGDATINNSGKLTVVNKAITDDKLDKQNIPLSGFGNPTDNVSFGDGTTNNRVVNLANPTGAQDGATKNYVDALFANPTALLTLPMGNLFVGNLSNKAVASTKNSIPISGFGSATSTLSMGDGTTNYKIVNVANPTAAQEVATKNYVDNRVIAPGNLTLLTGNLFVGNALNTASAVAKNSIAVSGFGAGLADIDVGGFKLINIADPMTAQHAATKNYVDTKAINAASLNLALASMFVGNGSGKATAVLKSAIPLSDFAPATANVALGNGTLNFKIMNLLDPTTDQDAATKKYVDGLFLTPSTSLALANGKVFVGNGSGKAIASATSTIPVSGFGKANSTLNMGDAATKYNISYLAEPLYPEDAATKNYVDSKSSGSGSISSTDLDISGGNNATQTDVVLSLRDNSITNAKLDKANIPLSGFAFAEGDIELGDGTNNYKIKNLATPVSGDPVSTAATKGYVDSAVSSSSISGSLYQGTVADLTAFMNLNWSGILAATLSGTSVSGTICTLSQTDFTWIAYPKVWGNQDFFYKYDSETYAVFSGFQKRIIPASATGSVDYQVFIFLTTPDREVSLVAGN